MSSPTTRRPADDPQITHTLRIERPETDLGPRRRAQFEAVATLLLLSEEASK